ncbi:MAG TPA: hypothetical protein PLC98_04115 [Anaerolineales bacterium]|nr:hypothetical protein [Anaerolineales bacterium]
MRRWTPLVLVCFNIGVYLALRVAAPPTLTGGDPARLGIQAWDFLERQVWPFYIQHLFAPNPLIVYLHAAAFAVFGVTLDALNGVTIAAGILASVAAYRAGCALFHDEGPIVGHRAGLIAALSFPLISVLTTFAGGGTEHILLPLFALTVTAALWHGLRTGRAVAFVLAGALLGVSQYAYIVARALPVALIGAVGLVFVIEPRYRRHWKGLAWAAGAFALTALPQALFFIEAPATFTARVAQSAGGFVFSRPDAAELVVMKAVQQLRMLGWDWVSGYNLSGRALLDPLLLAGLVLSLRRRPGHVFAWAMAGAFLILELITFEDIHPSATRLLGAIPFLLLLSGSGVARLWTWLAGRWRRAGWAVVAVVIGFGVERHYDLVTRAIPDYMRRPGVEWMASLVDQAEAAYILAHRDQPILLPASEYQRAPLTFLLAEAFPDRSGAATPPLRAGEKVTVIVASEPERPTTDGPQAGYIPDTWVLVKGGAIYLLPTLPGGVALGALEETLQARNGVPVAEVFDGVWQGGSPLPPAGQTVRFENGFELIGASLGSFVAGQPLDVTLLCAIHNPLPSDVQLVVQVLDAEGEKLAGVHDWILHGAYRARAWRVDETVPLNYRFEIPADLAPGRYRVAVGVFDIQAARFVPSAHGPDLATAALLKIPKPPPADHPPRFSDAVFGPVALESYALDPEPAGLKVRFLWRADQHVDFDFTLFVHVVDRHGNLIAQSDGQPDGGSYPTTLWDIDERFLEERTLAAPPGEYLVYVGWYRWDTGERLPAFFEGVPVSDNRLLLGSIVVR